MNDDDFELSFPESLRKFISPRVLAEVQKRIKQCVEAEADNPFYYRRYLNIHFEHILQEAIRKAALESDEADEVDPES